MRMSRVGLAVRATIDNRRPSLTTLVRCYLKGTVAVRAYSIRLAQMLADKLRLGCQDNQRRISQQRNNQRMEQNATTTD